MERKEDTRSTDSREEAGEAAEAEDSTANSSVKLGTWRDTLSALSPSGGAGEFVSAAPLAAAAVVEEAMAGS